jgi:hypothetical protein
VAETTRNIDTRQLDDGRVEVLDPVRRRWVALTPEEEVRQQTILMLHSHYGYPLELMLVEGAINLNGMTRRCDIVIFGTDGRPQVIVECKRPDVALSQKVCDQACRYNTVLQVPLLILTNGHRIAVIATDTAAGTMKQLPDIPHYVKKS